MFGQFLEVEFCSFGTFYVIGHDLSPGNIFACCFATLGGARRLGKALPQLRAIQNARYAAGDIFAIIDRVCGTLS